MPDHRRTVLLTGFLPFAGARTNPSMDAVRAVAADWRDPEHLVVDVLPVEFDAAADRLRALVAQHRPDMVVLTGLAGGRAAVGVERVAVNLVDARIPDESGAQPVDRPSVAGAPPAAFATLPVKAIAAAIRAAGIPAEVSHTAGTFVCNHVFFVATQAVPQGVRAGFVHLPWSTEEAPPDAPALPLDDLAEAVRIAVRTSLDAPVDSSAPGGALH